MKKNILLALVLVLIGAGGAFMYLHMKSDRSCLAPEHTMPVSAADQCAKHQIAEKDCPWCDSSNIEKKGQCLGHGVPEALCTKCNPTLIAGFKAEKDWCAGHNIPESQCKLCKAGQLPPGEKM